MFIRQALTVAAFMFLFAGCATMSAIQAEVSPKRVSPKENWNGILGIFDKAYEYARRDIMNEPVPATPKPVPVKPLVPVTSSTNQNPNSRVFKPVVTTPAIGAVAPAPQERLVVPNFTGYFELEIAWGRRGRIKNISSNHALVMKCWEHGGKLVKGSDLAWPYNFAPGEILIADLETNAELRVFALGTSFEKMCTPQAEIQKAYNHPNK